MAGRILGLILLILVTHQIQCQGPPKISKSYYAWGEITQAIENMPAKVQVAFEESYDNDTQNAAFLVMMAGKNVTFVKDFKTKQTFRYIERKECALATEEEWIKSQYPPGLLKYEDDDGTVRFSVKQLFSIPDNFLKAKDARTVFRGIPARVWLYEIPNKDNKDSKLVINSYWSDKKWNTSSNEDSTPLGFRVSSMQLEGKKMKVIDTVMSIFGFVTGTYDRKLFEPVEGIICADRQQTLKFPNVQNIKALSIHSEMVLPDYQEIKYIDTWFNPTSQIVRIDLERMKDEEPSEERKVKRYESEIAIGKMGVVFKKTIFKGEFKCEVIPFSAYENDMQNFIDIKNLTRWKMGKFFGLNDTNYVYTGQTTKSDIPCHLFQGIRKDYPEESANVQSLWEWCFNVNMTGSDKAIFRDDEIGLISAQVTILKSDKPDYPEGFRMFHHFYEVSPTSPAMMDAMRFDISRCFNESEKRYLQFSLDWSISNDELLVAENLTSDLDFLQRWKSAIYQHSGLPPYSLRIADLLATIEDKTLYIKFSILMVHSGLPKDIQKDQKSAFNAENDLRDKIKGGSVSISYPVNKKQKTMKAQRLSFQINPKFEPHTVEPLPPETTTLSTNFPFSLKTEPEVKETTTTTTASTEHTKIIVTDIHGSTLTEPDEITTIEPITTSGKPKEKRKRAVETRHKPGAVAAVSIAMLLVGITIGSAGTFYKYNGLPACISRQ